MGIASCTPEEASATSPARGVCSMSALEAVVGMGWDGVGMLKPGDLAHCSAPGESQPPPALAAISGTGRVTE